MEIIFGDFSTVIFQATPIQTFFSFLRPPPVRQGPRNAESGPAIRRTAEAPAATTAAAKIIENYFQVINMISNMIFGFVLFPKANSTSEFFDVDVAVNVDGQRPLADGRRIRHRIRHGCEKQIK